MLKVRRPPLLSFRSPFFFPRLSVRPFRRPPLPSRRRGWPRCRRVVGVEGGPVRRGRQGAAPERGRRGPALRRPVGGCSGPGGPRFSRFSLLRPVLVTWLSRGGSPWCCYQRMIFLFSPPPHFELKLFKISVSWWQPYPGYFHKICIWWQLYPGYVSPAVTFTPVAAV